MKVKKILDKFKRERAFRQYVYAGGSLLVSVAFAIYNLIVGVYFRLIWNFSISFYYLFLVAVRAFLLYGERKWEALPQTELFAKREKLFKIETLFLLCIDVALIAPIALLIFQRKEQADIGMIPTIAVAAFTTYKVVMACIRYTKSKKGENLTIYGLKIICLKEAIVSVITLQNTMVYVFGEVGQMQALTTCTNIGMYLSLLAISLCQAYKIRKTP